MGQEVSTPDGPDDEGSAAEETSTPAMDHERAALRKHLDAVQSAGKVKNVKRQRRELWLVVRLTMAQAQQCGTELEIAAHPDLVRGTVLSVQGNSLDELLLLAHFLMAVHPFSLNTGLGICRNAAHTVVGGGPCREAAADSDILMSEDYSAVTSNLSYVLLDSDHRIVRLAVFALATLSVHPSSRRISHEPQGLALLCSDSDPIVQYLAVTALGNLCAGSVEADEADGGLAISGDVHVVVRASLPFLLLLLFKPTTKILVVEAVLYTLFRFVSVTRSRELVAQAIITLSASGVAQAVRLDEVSGSLTQDSYRFLHALFGLLRLEDFADDVAAARAFPHLQEWCRASDLVYTLACLVVCELANAVGNEAIFAARTRHEDPLEASIQSPSYRASASRRTSRSQRRSLQSIHAPVAEERKTPSPQSFCELISQLVEQQAAAGEFSPAHVALVTASFLLHASADQPARGTATNHFLLTPLEQMFSRREEFGFDGFWRRFRVAPERVSARSQFLQTHLVEEICGGAAGLQSFLTAAARASAEVVQDAQDADFNEAWLTYFQGVVLDKVESLTVQDSRVLGAGEQHADHATPLLLVLQGTLWGCSDEKVFARALDVISHICIASLDDAKRLLDLGTTRLLIQILWILCQDQDLLDVRVISEPPPHHAIDVELFPSTSGSQPATSRDSRRRSKRRETIPDQPRESSLIESLLTSTRFPPSDFRARMLADAIFVDAGLAARVLHFHRALESSLLLTSLRALNAFVVHGALRESIGVELRARGLVYKVYEVFHEARVSEREVPLAVFGSGPAAETSSSAVLLHMMEPTVAAQVYHELAMAAGTLLPAEQTHSTQTWTDDENLDLVRHLVMVASTGTARDKSVSLEAQHSCVKALSALENISRSRGIESSMLAHTGVLGIIADVLELVEETLACGARQRELALRLLKNLVRSPDGMSLWLKLESDGRASIDSSGNVQPACIGSRHGCNPQLEAYRAMCWAARPGIDDASVLGPLGRFHSTQRALHLRSAALRVPVGEHCWGVEFTHDFAVMLGKDTTILGDAWSVGVWFVRNAAFDASLDAAQTCFTLIQSSCGDRPICVLRRDISGSEGRLGRIVFELGAYEAASQTWHGSGVDLGSLAPGWHHIMVTAFAGTTRYYVDGADVSPAGSVRYQPRGDVFVMGNSAARDEPWGIAADFRVYPFALGRDAQSWDHFVDARIWGLDCYPGPQEYTATKNRALAQNLGHARPPDFLRYCVATFRGGALLNILVEGLEEGSSSLPGLQTIAAEILGDLALCATARTQILASRAIACYVKFAAKNAKFAPPEQLEQAFNRLIALAR